MLSAWLKCIVNLQLRFSEKPMTLEENGDPETRADTNQFVHKWLAFMFVLVRIDWFAHCSKKSPS